MGSKKPINRVNDILDAFRGSPKKTIRELKRLVREGQETGDVVLIGAAYRAIAYTCIHNDDRDGALSNAIKAVALLKDTGEYKLLANAYNVLGYAYAEQENNQLALANYDKAYRILRRHRIVDDNRLYVINNLSTCYHMMGDSKAAIRYLHESLELTHAHFPDNYTDILMFSVNLAENHVDLKEYEKAREILQSISGLIEKCDYPALTCDYYLRRAFIEYQLENRAEGDRLVDEAFALVGGASEAYPLYEDLRLIARILVRNGDRERGEKVLGWMSAYAENHPDTMEQLIACRMMADYYGNTGEHERANAYYEKLDKLYEKRLSELKSIQLNVYHRMRDADAEIHKLNEKIRESEENASREPLTKLLNRAALLRVSSEFIELAAKKKERVGAIFIDIDFFKECNDTYGHAKGDEIIRDIARACQKEDTANVRFARYGGDEFFGIAHGLCDEKLAEIARRIAGRVRKADIPNEKNPNGGRVTLSIGVANVVITDRTNTIIDIANYADKAVYHAKETGKNAIYLLDYDRREEEEKDSLFVRIDF
ncbi:MAG: GGDEF domain-containing protein [Ruminococcaceae bacterium]|nr:GGDEF domain-containing protein [Oscillospiraceae bacterium]